MDCNEQKKRKQEAGKRIKTIRLSLGMNKEQFARLIGISGQYLGTLESGAYYLSSDKIVTLCEKTGFSADYILFGKENTINEDLIKVLSEFDCSNLAEAFKIIENLALFVSENYK